VSGESCCGGNYGLFIYNWFDTERATAFMDWVVTVIGMRIGIGSNTTLMMNAFLYEDGLAELDLGFEFVW